MIGGAAKDRTRERAGNRQTLTVGLLGNPNCGKTTLFNALTGSHVKVANWPGVTVERTEGELVYQNLSIRLIDLPGVYSLDSGSMEEKVSADWLESGEADVIINVVNATALERNLYLTVQLLEKKVPVVLALNLMDVAEQQGIRIDTGILSEGLEQIPVIPVSARKRTGLDGLLDAVVESGRQKDQNRRKWRRMMREDIYRFTERLTGRAVRGGETRRRSTDRADRLLTHPIWGVPLFCLMMAAVFTLTFTLGDWLKGYLEGLLRWGMAEGKQLFVRWGISGWISSLVFDGVLAGVGGILTFLPNLLILYLSLALLEDSGYMARAAYVMNETMGYLGMSGKAFLPMILGFGCTVPAAAATGALENQREKRKVLSILPFISCSAKLPVYTLFAGAFFGSYAVFVAYTLCAAGAVFGLFYGWRIYRRKKKRLKEGAEEMSEEAPLLIELPDYRMPDPRTVRMDVWGKIKDYLSRAGTVIFLASMILWFVLGYGPKGVADSVEESFAALIGNVIAPLFRPAGFGVWQLCVALICGLSAKEVVVSSCLVMFRLGGEAAGAQSLTAAFHASLLASGVGPAGALAFLVFCLLYSPCAAALAAIRKESGSAAWTAWLAVRQTLFAWAGAVLVYWITK